MAAALAAALAAAAASVAGGPPAVDAPAERPAPTPAQLAGQRIVYGFPGTAPPAGLVRRIRRGEAGAVIIMGGNVAGRAQLRRLTARLQSIPRPAAVDAPLLVMVDQEGGSVRRIPGPPRSASALGAGDPAATRAAGRATARLLAGAGVNVDLAPVADVAGPGSVLAAQGRTFASGPGGVARHAVAFAAGLRAGGVAATAKHFPGFGAARVNTDDAPVVIRRSAAALRRVDMRPFRAVIAHRVPLVMTTSAVYPALDPGTPALLSRRIVDGELRRRLGFRGVVVTDALDTPALEAVAGDRAVAVRAAAAGNDLLLYVDGARGAGAARALADAMRGGSLRPDEAHAAWQRILRLREGVAGG